MGKLRLHSMKKPEQAKKLRQKMEPINKGRIYVLRY